ncbi:hypothetical protein C8T65DRAFT_626513 [Cerioporus squamosus]|nr:hypothetical protein C8T65DRAFT_626513 [Cerioporus squamosus]
MSERCCASKRLKMAEAELLELEENVRVFSPKDFLSAASPRGSMHTATASEGIIFQIGERLELPWNVNTLCVPGRYISKNHKEIVWADNMKTRCVALSPTHRYDPNAAGGNGGWETPFDMKRHPGEEMDMFYKNERKEWEYVGTYRCVGQTILSCREVESFAMSRMNSAIDRTMVGGPLPTIMQNAVKQMFAMDVLKIACTGWERVSFNQVLARVLRAERHQTADSGQGPESAPPAKRHGQDGETGGKEWKRHKRTRRG